MSRKRDPGLREAWRKRLQRFDRCELTVVEFCEREAVSPAAFYAWQRRLRPKPVALQPTFVPLRLPSDANRPSTVGELRLKLPNGTSVRLVQPEECLLRALIAAAGALPSEVPPC